MILGVRSGAALLLLLACGTACGSSEDPAHTAAAPAAAPAPAPTAVPAQTPGRATAAVPGLSSAPLIDPGGAVPGPRFEKLDGATSGIDFVHRRNQDPAYLHVLANAMSGGGVALGDADGDGLADVLLTRPAGGARLYRNLGDFRFEDVTEAAGLEGDAPWSGGASFADLDGDGDQDLYICGYDTPNRLYWNHGDGTFEEGAEAAGLAFSGASIVMAFADADNDGDLDGYLLTNRHLGTSPPLGDPFSQVNGRFGVRPEFEELHAVLDKPDGSQMFISAGQRDRFYRNDGDGTFSEITALTGMSGNHYGLSATWWDYDDDGDQDLYVANDFFGPDHLYRNEGNLRFLDVATAALPHTPWFSMGADAADIDNDGDLDFLASDMSGTSHYRQKVAMGNMADSGWFLSSSVPRQYMRNAVYINTGTGRFGEAANLLGVDSTDWTWSPVFGDLDLDGRVDLYVSNGMTRDFFHSDKRSLAMQLGRDREMSELWLDEPALKERNLVFRNAGDLHMEAADDWGLGHAAASFGAALGDLDGDGDLDLVTNDFEEAAGVYRNRTADGHRLVVALHGTWSERHGVGATVRVETDGDPGLQVRHLTLSRGFMAGHEPLACFGLGDQDQVRRLTVSWPSGHEQVFEGLAADQRYSITEPEHRPPPRQAKTHEPPIFIGSAGHRSVERPYDDFSRQPLLPYQLSRLGPGLASGDLDADGDLDYVVGGPAGQSAVVYRNMESRRFEPWLQPALPADAGCEDAGLVLFDANGDGALDLYIVSGGVECEPGDPVLRDRLYLNDGRGVLVRAADALPDLRDSGSTAAASDFDGDGDLDLFVGGRSVPGSYPVAPSSRLLRNDDGRFTDVTDALAPGLGATGLVTSALWCDVDDDADADLLVATEWGPVELWRHEGAGFVDATGPARLAGRRGWWNGLAAGDVDHDGDLDVVATNFGLNTKYHATHEKPALLYYGDFEGTGKNHLVEAEFEDEVLFPGRGRSCSSNAMPFVAEKFTNFENFAVASLEEIYTEACLADALRLSVDSLESVLLINDGRGTFEPAVLPRLAQIAPAFGVVVTELDGDGHPDIVLGQNFFASQAETGNMDGGTSLVLRGHGDGRFTPLQPRESGLLVAGDATGVITTDFDGNGRPDLLVAQNDNALHGLLNRSADGAPGFAVSLVGTAGNARGIGARVTLQLDDGTTQTAEVTAGGSYLSSSAPVLFFGVPAGRRATAYRVRWPDGSFSTHAGPTPGLNRLSHP